MTPEEPGASRVDELRRMLVMQIRQLVALEVAIAASKSQERDLAKLLGDELKRTPRGAGRPYKLDQLDAEDRIGLIRKVVRLSLTGASRREIARAAGTTRLQVDNILGHEQAA